MMGHVWRSGAVLPAVFVNGVLAKPAASLSSCVGCGTLRVLDGERAAYVRRRADAERVTEAEPPCLSPRAAFRAPW